LDIGQRVLVNRFVYHFADPKIGDIVVFHPPVGANSSSCGVNQGERQPCPAPTPEEDGDTNFIKRIVAGPGDRLSIRDGHPVVNGVLKEDEPYIRPCEEQASDCDMATEITVPPDHYFMMGDNRASGQSDDSRFWGPVPREWIIGKAFATYWPPKRIGIF
jgi:signal peptidase I